MLSVKYCLAMNAVYYRDKIRQLPGTSDDISIWSVLRSRFPCTLPPCLEERCRTRLNLFSQQLYSPFGLSKLRNHASICSHITFPLLSNRSFGSPLSCSGINPWWPSLSWTLFNIFWLGQQQQNMLFIARAVFDGATLLSLVQRHDRRNTRNTCLLLPGTTA